MDLIVYNAMPLWLRHTVYYGRMRKGSTTLIKSSHLSGRATRRAMAAVNTEINVLQSNEIVRRLMAATPCTAPLQMTKERKKQNEKSQSRKTKKGAI